MDSEVFFSNAEVFFGGGGCERLGPKDIKMGAMENISGNGNGYILTKAARSRLTTIICRNLPA